MIKRPWQIWVAFATTVAVALAAAVWLTAVTLRVEAERETERVRTEQARREAELQERINSALYRMDWILTPLIAQEAARPYYLYQPFYNRPSNPGAPVPETESQEPPSRLPSPLLLKPSEFVRLHFQVDRENRVTSPQRPLGDDCDLAIACCGVSPSTFQDNDPLLEQVRSFASFDRLAQRCPPLVSESESPNPLATPDRVYIDPFFDNRQSDRSGESQTVQQEENSPSQQRWAPDQLSRNYRMTQRGSTELFKRVEAAQKMAESQWMANNLEFNRGPAESTLVREGVMRPIWLDGQLVLTRRVAGLSSQLIQCCWLNWERIQAALREEVRDILPQIEFDRVESDQDLQVGRVLATLPVRIVVPTDQLLASLGKKSALIPRAAISGTGWSLILAWSGLLFAVVALGLLLHGVLQLSERRATFVSAVSHELRTPLTTFRMYADLMAADMIPGEKKKQYFSTLQVQADRLTRLVNNILHYSRLEKSPHSCRQPVAIGDLLTGVHEAIERRAEEAGMEIEWRLPTGDEALIQLETDVTQVEQIVFNLVDNSCKYARNATRATIAIEMDVEPRSIRIQVRDFGPGISPATWKKSVRPFSKSDQEAANSAEGVGLGLALCRRMAAYLGGKLRRLPTNPGAHLELELPRDNRGNRVRGGDPEPGSECPPDSPAFN